MREYGKVLSRFWVDCAHLSAETKLVACYVFSCEHGNAVGLFRLPLTFVEEGTGLPSEGASKGLAEGLAEGLWKYDEKAGHIYVPGAAEESYPKPLKGGSTKPDKRWTGLVSLLDRLRRHPFYGDFSQRYSEHLAIPEGLRKPLGKTLPKGFGQDPSEGQSKPLPKHKDGDGDVDGDPPKAPQGAGASSGDSPAAPGLWAIFDRSRAQEYLGELREHWPGLNVPANRQPDAAQGLFAHFSGLAPAERSRAFGRLAKAYRERDFMPTSVAKFLAESDLTKVAGSAGDAPRSLNIAPDPRLDANGKLIEPEDMRDRHLCLPEVPVLFELPEQQP